MDFYEEGLDDIQTWIDELERIDQYIEEIENNIEDETFTENMENDTA